MKTTQIVILGGLVLTLIGIFFTVALPYFMIQPPPSAAAVDWAKASPQVVKGRQVYVREGCFYCHSQQVRFNDETNEALRPDKVFGRASHEGDYVHDAPALLGTERQGPDLRWEGDRQPSDLWHYRHLWNPQLTSAGSIMPSFSYLFLAGSSDAKPLPALDAEALVAYLLALKTNEAPPAAPGAVAAGLTLDTPLPAGNEQNGQALFTSQGCAACHSLKPDEKVVGPSLFGIGKTALTRIKAPDYTGKATSPETYLKESILLPSAYVVPGFPDAMLKDFGVKLNAQQLADIIAFLQTQ
jgi:cytochrome c oxidase cbb3-type subunit 2